MEFWQNLTYKNRIIILITGFIFVFILVYSLALSETTGLARDYRKIKKQLENIQSAPQQIEFYQARLAKINNILGSNYEQNVDRQELLLEQVSKYCNTANIVLKEFPSVHQIELNDYVIETYSFTVEGPFIKLLRLLHNLEMDFSFGKICSAEFHSLRDIKLKRDVLRLTIYIQNIKNLKS